MNQRIAILIVSFFVIAPVLHAAETSPTAPPGTALNRVVAVINDSVLTEVELQQEIDKVVTQLEQQRLQVPPRDTLREQVLNRAVLRELQLKRADSRRIRVDDDTLNRAIESISQRNGMDIAAFRDVLERDGMDYAAYREDVRKEMIIGRLQQQEIASQVNVSQQEIDNFLINEELRGSADSEYDLGHILVAVPEAATPEQVDAAQRRIQTLRARVLAGEDFAQVAVAESDGQHALEGGNLGWRKAGELPTLFADRIVSMEPGEISDVLRSPSGFHILKLIDKRRSDIAQSLTQFHARHILISASETLPDEEARQRIENLRDRVRAGEDFAELARVHSEDQVSATQGGDLGWMSGEEFVPPLPQVLQNLKPGELSQPVQTRFGWHLVQLLESRELDDATDLLRNRARGLIQQRKVEEAQQDWLRRLRDEAFVEYRL